MIDAFDYTPYLHIGSPVKRCGKSRVFDCLRLICAHSWPVVSITEAVLFRKIEQDCPTLLLDEVDAIFTAKRDDSKEGLRAVLNSGFERRATVPRCVGPNHLLCEFRVFCPKALAGIGKLPDTIADRSIPIVMARRSRGQHVEKFRMRDAEVIATPITAALRAWSGNAATIAKLRAACPEIPNNLEDRAADICEPILAVADLAGDRWPAAARSGLVKLCTPSAAGGDDIAIKLLAAIQEIFESRDLDRISTRDLLDALVARDTDEPWAAWWESDIMKGNVRGPSAKLAKLLKPFEIVPETIRESCDNTAKGYKLATFKDAFSRYLPEKS